MVIGQARDLRSCEALRRDTGKACGDWCDACVSLSPTSLSIAY